MLLLRARLPTLAHDETKVRPWLHQTKHIKHNRYLSHGCARPNASVIYEHTWFSGVPDVRRLLQPTGSAAVSSRVRWALGPYLRSRELRLHRHYYHHNHWAAAVSRSWAKASLCRLKVNLYCAVRCQIVALQYCPGRLYTAWLVSCVVITMFI